MRKTKLRFHNVGRATIGRRDPSQPVRRTTAQYPARSGHNENPGLPGAGPCGYPSRIALLTLLFVLSILVMTIRSGRCDVSEKMASRECILIAIVAAAGEAGLDRVQLQKSVFLVGEEFDGKLPADFYQFQPYMYGPFAQDVYADIERLCDGLVIEALTGKDGRPSYRLAPGATAGLCGLSDLSEDLESGIRQIVGWVTSMSFNELVRAVYHLYPEQRENSVFQDYSDEKAQEESFQRGFSEIAAGGGRPALELVDELLRDSAVD